jgi:uncharacterized protein
MDIKITGASGYLGKVITDELESRGHRVTGIDRGLLYGPAETLGKEFQNAGAVINLAGAPILQRWTAKNKKQIYDSRIVTAQNIARAFFIMNPEKRPKKVVTASAMNIYKARESHRETSIDFETGFLGKLIAGWENAWDKLPDGVDLTVFRMAVVLGKNSATIKNMLLPFKLGLGGKIGSGKQPFPFVHEKDVARAYSWALEKPETNGIFNLAAPQQISNAAFTSALAKKLRRPAFFRIPPFVLHLLYGEAATLLAESPAIIPDALESAGFKFQFPTIEAALEEILQ